MRGATDTTTTVVITRNRAADLRRSLEHHRPPVIVLDNASSDETRDLVRNEFPDVGLVALDRNLGAVARNIGVQLARTPLVAFADDDSWWSCGALARAEQEFRHYPRLALLAGRVLVGEAYRPDPIVASMALAPLGIAADLPGPSVLGFLACGAIVRRSAFLAVGGFDDLIEFGGEEELLALDLAADGWGLAYVDDVVAHHFPSRTRRGSERHVQIARNRVLSAVMRRSWPGVAATVIGTVTTRKGLRGICSAGRHMWPALKRRRPLPSHVESAYRLLER